MSTRVCPELAHSACAVPLPVRLWPPRQLRLGSTAHGHLRSLGSSRPQRALRPHCNAFHAASVPSASPDRRSDAESLLEHPSDQLGGTSQRWTALAQRLPHLLPLLLLAAVVCTRGGLAATMPLSLSPWPPLHLYCARQVYYRCYCASVLLLVARLSARHAFGQAPRLFQPRWRSWACCMRGACRWLPQPRLRTWHAVCARQPRPPAVTLPPAAAQPASRRPPNPPRYTEPPHPLAG